MCDLFCQLTQLTVLFESRQYSNISAQVTLVLFLTNRISTLNVDLNYRLTVHYFYSQIALML